MKIGIDFDGVIADSTKIKLALAKELFNLAPDPNRLKESLVIEDGVMTQPQYRQIMEKACIDLSWGLQMEICTGAKEGLASLAAAGHELHIVTSRDEAELATATAWCQQNDIQIPFYSVGYGNTKTQMATELDLEVFLDDDLSKLEPLQGAVPHLCLYSAPHNQHQTPPAYVTRVDWPTFVAYIAKNA